MPVQSHAERMLFLGQLVDEVLASGFITSDVQFRMQIIILTTSCIFLKRTCNSDIKRLRGLFAL